MRRSAAALLCVAVVTDVGSPIAGRDRMPDLEEPDRMPDLEEPDLIPGLLEHK